MKILAKFSYPNRALEAFIIANAERKGRITPPVNKLTNVYTDTVYVLHPFCMEHAYGRV